MSFKKKNLSLDTDEINRESEMRGEMLKDNALVYMDQEKQVDEAQYGAEQTNAAAKNMRLSNTENERYGVVKGDSDFEDENCL